jgi:Uma2 family endonuclease
MVIQQKTVTAQAFWEFVNRPENQNRFFERVHGEIVEVGFSSTYYSVVAVEFAFHITKHVRENEIAGYVTREGGGYDIDADNTYAPDAAFISKVRLPQLPRQGFAPVAPDLVVEVVSPSSTTAEIQRKTQDYLKAGVRLVIVAYPDTKSIVVHTREGAKTLEADAIFDGGEVLPGFSLRVGDLFP